MRTLHVVCVCGDRVTGGEGNEREGGGEAEAQVFDVGDRYGAERERERERKKNMIVVCTLYDVWCITGTILLVHARAAAVH